MENGEITLKNGALLGSQKNLRHEQWKIEEKQFQEAGRNQLNETRNQDQKKFRDNLTKTLREKKNISKLDPIDWGDLPQEEIDRIQKDRLKKETKKANENARNTTTNPRDYEESKKGRRKEFKQRKEQYGKEKKERENRRNIVDQLIKEGYGEKEAMQLVFNSNTSSIEHNS